MLIRAYEWLPTSALVLEQLHPSSSQLHPSSSSSCTPHPTEVANYFEHTVLVQSPLLQSDRIRLGQSARPVVSLHHHEGERRHDPAKRTTKLTRRYVASLLAISHSPLTLTPRPTEATALYFAPSVVYLLASALG